MTNDFATLVDVGAAQLTLRGVSVGEATGQIETVHEGSFDFEVEVRAIDRERIELIHTAFDAIYPIETLAYITEATLRFQHVKQYRLPAIGGERYYDLQGNAVISFDARQTQASIMLPEPGSTPIIIETGAVPGSVTLSASTGATHTFDIVGPEDIAALKLFKGDLPTQPVMLGSSDIERLRIVPLLDEKRAISGCSPDEPEITVSSTVIKATLREGSLYCWIELERSAPGPATVTVAWGSATATVEVLDAEPNQPM